MLELLKVFLEKIDFLAIAEALRKRKNRRIAAQLHVILVQSYEIIELYRVLLDELSAALKSHQRRDDQHRFELNPHRVAALLSRQSSNLSVMVTLTSDLMGELRILDNRFAEAYQSIFPGKFSILFEAEQLLAEGRLPLAESGPDRFPANANGEYRALWFTPDAPKEDRQQLEQYLYGWNGREKMVVDVNVHDGDAFFMELQRYFVDDDPVGRLQAIEVLTEKYRDALLQNFNVEDLLGDIGKVRRHYS